jgi:hypothetical protein
LISGNNERAMYKPRKYFIEGFNAWRKELFEYRYLILLSLVIVVIATYLDYLSGTYVSTKAETAHVPDLILDHFGPMDASYLYVWGYIGLCSVLLLYPLIFHIGKLHIIISQFSFLVMLRSIFLILTHLETPPDAISVHFPGIFQGLSFQNDMFFSGHTAVPFLGFLLYKGWLRYFFLCGSILMGTAVLLCHVHYSIDVFSAFFITYCCHKIGTVIINKTERWLKS